MINNEMAIVQTGMVAKLAQTLSTDLNKEVSVLRRPKGKSFEYYLKFKDSNPPVFGPVNINQARRSLAMLIDLLSSRIIRKVEVG